MINKFGNQYILSKHWTDHNLELYNVKMIGLVLYKIFAISSILDTMFMGFTANYRWSPFCIYSYNTSFSPSLLSQSSLQTSDSLHTLLACLQRTYSNICTTLFYRGMWVCLFAVVEARI